MLFRSAASSVGQAAKAATKPAAKGGKSPVSGVAALVDPLQLWGALTQQFQQIAASAMKEVGRNTTIDATKNMAAGLAKEAIKAATRPAVRKPARKRSGT